MKNNLNFKFPSIYLIVATIWVSFLSSCDDNEPTKEDTPELITKATLTFTPQGGGTPVMAIATDPDGEGVQNLATNGPIDLATNTTYSLSIALINELADPTDAEYDITEEVEEEGDEHMLFFSWTNNVFSNPAGNGNIDNRTDLVNYNDEDVNGQPIGLESSWTTTEPSSGKFRVMLKHQPGIKTSTSGSTEGETDLDLEFDITVD